MTRNALLLGSALSLALLAAAGSAQAGACSAEIMALQQQLAGTPTLASGGSAIDPGAGIDAAATPGTTNANPGPNPLPAPGAAASAAGKTLGQAPSSDPGGMYDSAHAAPSGSGEAASTPGTDPDPLPDADGGILVQGGGNTKPARTPPLDADAAQGGAMQTGTGGTDLDEAAKALARARAFDQAGDEGACMNAVNEAKGRLGQ